MWSFSSKTSCKQQPDYSTVEVADQGPATKVPILPSSTNQDIHILPTHADVSMQMAYAFDHTIKVQRMKANSFSSASTANYSQYFEKTINPSSQALDQIQAMDTELPDLRHTSLQEQYWCIVTRINKDRFAVIQGQKQKAIDVTCGTEENNTSRGQDWPKIMLIFQVYQELVF